MKFLESIADALVDRTPEELIGALMVASAIACALAGLYALGRRKSPCSATFVGLLALAGCVLCMVLGAGYVQFKEHRLESGSASGPRRFPAWSVAGPPPGPWGFYGPGWSSGFQVVVAADEDRDGRVDFEELARLIRKADADGDGSVDFRDIDRAIMGRTRPPIPPEKADPDANQAASGAGEGASNE